MRAADAECSISARRTDRSHRSLCRPPGSHAISDSTGISAATLLIFLQLLPIASPLSYSTCTGTGVSPSEATRNRSLQCRPRFPFPSIGSPPLHRLCLPSAGYPSPARRAGSPSSTTPPRPSSLSLSTPTARLGAKLSYLEEPEESSEAFLSRRARRKADSTRPKRAAILVSPKKGQNGALL